MTVPRFVKLKVILASASLVILITTAGLILGIAIYTTRSTVINLANELMEQKTETVSARIKQYFRPAIRIINYTHQAIIRSPDDLGNWQDKASELIPLLKILPQMTWIYYADQEQGRLLGSTYFEERHLLHYSVEADNGERVIREFTLESDGSLTPYQRDQFSDSKGYDPRERPWYRLAAESKSKIPIWTQPYNFFTEEISGITACWPHRDPDTQELLGVYAVDILLEDLCMFIDSIQIEEGGGVNLLKVDGSSFFQDTNPDARHSGKAFESLILTLKEKMVDLDSLIENEGENQAYQLDFHSQDTWYFANIVKLSGDLVPDSYLVVIVPALNFIKVAQDNAMLTVLLAMVALFLAIALSLKLAHRISAPLTRLSHDMARISEYDITSDNLTPTNIEELNVVNGSLSKMKTSLRNFSRYVPSDLVRAALSSGQEAEVGGKVKELTVLFADLAGFTSLSENLSPDEVFKELSQCLLILTSHPEKLGGSMLTFLGDGILVVFNAPQPLDDHPAVACRAALNIHYELLKLNASRAKENKPPFKVRVGINTGEILVGNVGIPNRFSYSVLGDGVNLASRLEGLNKVYGTRTLVGSRTQALSKNAFEWRQIDSISVVGRRTAETIYEPLDPELCGCPEILKARDQYEIGLKSYIQRDFDTAVKAFKCSLEFRPDDQAAKHLIERCEIFQKTPPPKDWNGSYQALSK
ncbi:MAG: adenylate/guanylate cyclase domain-containing protein [Verrucomicrobiota bacterium]